MTAPAASPEAPTGTANADLRWVAGYVEAQHWTPDGVSSHERAFPEEVPVAFVVNDTDYAVMLATPADIRNFAYGFLLSEGLIAGAEEVESVNVFTRPEGLIAHVRLLGALPAARREHRLSGVSSCGLCGVTRLQDAIRPMVRVADGPVFESRAITRAMAALHQHQPFNAATGATHAAAFANVQGEIRQAREDVGRHNALDKLIGALLQNATAPEAGFVVMSSRCSYELVQKASAFGIRMLCTVSAPTALAIRLAREANITLVSLVRDDSFIVLTGSGRITGNQDRTEAFANG